MVELENDSRPRDASLPPLTYGRRRHYLDIIKYERARTSTQPRKNSVRRSDIELYMDILNAINITTKPTKIMYQSNLSWQPFQDRLEFLERAGFIKVEVTGQDVDGRSREALYLTPLGVEALEAWRKAFNMMYDALQRVLAQ